MLIIFHEISVSSVNFARNAMEFYMFPCKIWSLVICVLGLSQEGGHVWNK